MSQASIRRLGPEDSNVVLRAAHLFDDVPRREWTDRFLSGRDYVMLLAELDGEPVGFLTAVEIVHPDKDAELLIYELGVDEPMRRHGIGRRLVDAAIEHARQSELRGMWVPFEPDNAAALATYRAAGGAVPENASIINWDFPAD